MPDEINKHMNKPKTLDEAVIALDTILTKEDKMLLIAAVDKKEAAISLHSSLGRHLRNEWELWAGSGLALHLKEIYGIIHPDDMSHKIIMTYVNSLVK
jgi:hypothetical protein